MTLMLKSLFLALVLFTTPAYSIDKECKENLLFSFDNREWVKGFENENDEGSIIEFTLKNESVDNWSELISVQRFFSIDNLEIFYQLFLKDLKKSIAPAEVQSKLISQNDQVIFFEWWVDGDKAVAQHEWFKMMKAPCSTLILRYTTKKLEDVEKVRGTWEKILNEARVEPGK